MNCQIKLPDGNLKDFPSCPTGLELAQSIGPRLAKDTVAVLINQNSEITDFRSLLKDGDSVEILAIPSEKSLRVIRHSAAHVLAQAVQNIWPEVKVTIGPVIENGFYYDFDTDKKFTSEDLEKIEKEMRELLKQKSPVTREIWSAKKACNHFEQKGELLKAEIIKDLGVKEVSIYKQGSWLDLCRGPHVQHLGQIGAIKILSQSGAYWRGDSKNKQLQRIYGTAFHTEKQLNAFLKKQEEAKEYDHRKIGKKLNLFWFSELAAGSPFFTSAGTSVYRRMQNFLMEKYREYNYEEVISPQMYDQELFKRSGHATHFKDNMYQILEEERVYFLKPMNCPGHCLLYKKDRQSYRDLPLKMADFGRLHRKEPAGSLQGLTRVKSFCQDDAHIFCRLDQLSHEIQEGILMLQEVYKIFGLKSYTIEMATRPENRMGSDILWDKAEKALKDSLQSLNLSYRIAEGEGAFYGPKLDISVKDVFDRSWQLGTFQCDFNLPKAFDLNYINEKDKEERPVMVHRALLGSLERFIGVYLEHCRGRLPTWLSPVQVIVLPLTDKEKDFSVKIQKTLEQVEIICKIDDRNEKLSYKIRESQNQQIPYMLVIGKKEVQTQHVSVRLRSGELFSHLNLEEFKNSLVEEIHNRSLSSFLLKNHSKESNY